MNKKTGVTSVPGEHGGNSNPRTTRIESLERSRCEETGWMDERCTDRGDCQVVGGSGENFERSGSKEEQTPRGIEKESTMKDVRMSDDGLDGLDGSLSS